MPIVKTFPFQFLQSTHDRSATNNANTSSGSGNEQSSGGYTCPAPDCGRVYKLKSSLRNHQKWECGKVNTKFTCLFKNRKNEFPMENDAIQFVL